MFGINYDTWQSVCKMYFSLSTKSQKAYLQWFPFSRLSENEKETIISLDFYKNYIESGAFIMYPAAMHRSENYIQKADGSFRDATLVSPVLYLVLQAVGKRISEYYTRENESVDTFYAGNYQAMRPKYKHDYDAFFKAINVNKETHQFFIKTDITNFFGSINADILFNRIDKVCNQESVTITQAEMTLYKELLLYCGNGRFPLIENSLASSYLATVVYLDEIDERISTFITEKVPYFNSYSLIRYVDDMYILFSTDASSYDRQSAYNMIHNEYSSILKDYGLQLNSKKCCIKPINCINEELKKSLYDEVVYGKRSNIVDLFPNAIVDFLGELYKHLDSHNIGMEEYCGLIEKHFSSDDIEYTPEEVFNYFIYEEDSLLKTEKAIDYITNLINKDISYIALDAKRLSVMIMKTGTSGKNDKTVKALLNNLFRRDRSGDWNSYDTIAAISYLIQSRFQHIELLSVLKRRCKGFHEYYSFNCARGFISALNDSNTDMICHLIGSDWKAFYLRFMFFVSAKKKNYLAAYSYYKNYFDRVTADIAFQSGYKKKKNKPSYNSFYKKDSFIDFYSKRLESGRVTAAIKKAQDLRHENPLVHSSAGLIDNDSSSKEIVATVNSLEELIHDFIAKG